MLRGTEKKINRTDTEEVLRRVNKRGMIPKVRQRKPLKRWSRARGQSLITYTITEIYTYKNKKVAPTNSIHGGG